MWFPPPAVAVLTLYSTMLLVAIETVFKQVNIDKDKAERKEQVKFTKAGVGELC